MRDGYKVNENGEGICPSDIIGIKKQAFEDCLDLKSIIIPDTVTVICVSAFKNCKNLESIVIPNGFTKIGYASFDGCKNLKSIIIPDGLTEIYDYAFFNCKCLETITIPNSVSYIEKYVFYGCQNLVSVNYKNKTMQTKCIDNYLVEILRTITTSNYSIFKCKFFNSNEVCYAVEKNGIIAIGKTIKKAYEKIQFKI